jgi:dolichol-phosphate mannosyltransferase
MPITYSFIVPIFNDGYLAEEFCTYFEQSMGGYLKVNNISKDVELIFVNDGSPQPESMEILQQIATKFNFVKVINLSRNFGQHIAVSCGYKYASGKYVGMLNVDMQDPPDQIPKLLSIIENNDIDIVYGLRNNRKDKWYRIFFSNLQGRFLNYLTNTRTPLNVATLRIMNRKFIDAYNQFTEKSRYLPGLESWLGFKQQYAVIEHQERKKGKSSYTFWKLIKISLESIISFSDFPLKIFSFSGMCIAIIGFILTGILVIQKLFFINFQPGYTSSVSIMLLVGGIQIFVTGLVGLYIGRILKEVQNRPLFVVRDFINFDVGDE